MVDVGCEEEKIKNSEGIKIPEEFESSEEIKSPQKISSDEEIKSSKTWTYEIESTKLS